MMVWFLRSLYKRLPYALQPQILDHTLEFNLAINFLDFFAVVSVTKLEGLLQVVLQIQVSNPGNYIFHSYN